MRNGLSTDYSTYEAAARNGSSTDYSTYEAAAARRGAGGGGAHGLTIIRDSGDNNSGLHGTIHLTPGDLIEDARSVPASAAPRLPNVHTFKDLDGRAPVVRHWNPRTDPRTVQCGIRGIRSLAPFRNRINRQTGKPYPPPVLAMSSHVQMAELARPVSTLIYNPQKDAFELTAEGRRRRALLYRMLQVDTPSEVSIRGTATGQAQPQTAASVPLREQLCLKRWLKGYDDDIYVNRLRDFVSIPSDELPASASWLNASSYNTNCLVQTPSNFSFADIALIEAYGLDRPPFSWSLRDGIAFHPRCTRESDNSKYMVWLPSKQSCQTVGTDVARTNAFMSANFCPEGTRAQGRRGAGKISCVSPSVSPAAATPHE